LLFTLFATTSGNRDGNTFIYLGSPSTGSWINGGVTKGPPLEPPWTSGGDGGGQRWCMGVCCGVEARRGKVFGGSYEMNGGVEGYGGCCGGWAEWSWLVRRGPPWCGWSAMVI
jgi:hypothetical protein